MSKRTKISAFDIEVIGNIVRGLTQSPDVVDETGFNKLIIMLEMASNATIYS